MKMSHFLFYTGIGSALWVSILAGIGYTCGKNIDLIKQYAHICTIGVIAGSALIIAVYVWAHKRRQARFGQDATAKDLP